MHITQTDLTVQPLQELSLGMQTIAMKYADAIQEAMRETYSEDVEAAVRKAKNAMAQAINALLQPYSQSIDAVTAIDASNDMLDSARLELELLRNALGVAVEPHQSLSERMLEAASNKAQ